MTALAKRGTTSRTRTSAKRLQRRGESVQSEIIGGSSVSPRPSTSCDLRGVLQIEAEWSRTTDCDTLEDLKDSTDIDRQNHEPSTWQLIPNEKSTDHRHHRSGWFLSRGIPSRERLRRLRDHPPFQQFQH